MAARTGKSAHVTPVEGVVLVKVIDEPGDEGAEVAAQPTAGGAHDVVDELSSELGAEEATQVGEELANEGAAHIVEELSNEGAEEAAQVDGELGSGQGAEEATQVVEELGNDGAEEVDDELGNEQGAEWGRTGGSRAWQCRKTFGMLKCMWRAWL